MMAGQEQLKEKKTLGQYRGVGFRLLEFKSGILRLFYQDVIVRDFATVHTPIDSIRKACACHLRKLDSVA